MVVHIKMMRAELLCPLPTDIYPVPFRDGDRSAVGRIAHLPVAGACRIDGPSQPFAIPHMLPPTVCQLRPANNTQTYHQYHHNQKEKLKYKFNSFSLLALD